MRKPVMIIIAVGLILMLCACRTETATQVAMPTKVNTSETEIGKLQSEIPSVYLMKYPVLHNADYDYSLHNEAIKNLLEQKAVYLLDGSSEIATLSTDYSIMLQSAENISILYKLYANMKDTAHPTNVEFGINMDATGLPVNFQDVIAVDQKFVSQFRTVWNEQCGEDLQNYLDQYEDAELMELFSNVDSVGSDISFYLTEEGVSILFPVPRAAGSYVHINITRGQGAGSLSSKSNAESDDKNNSNIFDEIYGEKYFKMEDFASIIMGESTLGDLLKIDSSFDLLATSYGGLCEFPTENGGKILVKLGPDMIVIDISEVA